MPSLLRISAAAVIAAAAVFAVAGCKKKEKTPVEKLQDRMKKDSARIAEEAEEVKDKVKQETNE